MYLSHEMKSEVKIIDFGLAKETTNGVLSTPCGTAKYAAPEIISGEKYSTASDMWSLGVVTYMLLCGFQPFFGSTTPRLYRAIKAGLFSFPAPHWNGTSGFVQDFIRKLLVLDPKKRMTATQALDHSWLDGYTAKTNDKSKLFKEQIKYFQSSKYLKDVKINKNTLKMLDENSDIGDIHPVQPEILFANKKHVHDYVYPEKKDGHYY